MTVLVDLVNFNADASCLSAKAWLQALDGGMESTLCRWLKLYVTMRKKVALGLTGATIADLRALNPESVDLINENAEIFEIILRPFSHDIALLRGRDAFLLNLDLGERAARREFSRVTAFYLPPEFMLTNEQVSLLANRALTGVAVNAGRLSDDLQRRIPDSPYLLHGIGDVRMPCLPVQGVLTQAYLDSLHAYHALPWNRAIGGLERAMAVSWRDGESAFLLPDGVGREHAWLEGERGVQRAHLREVNVEYRDPLRLTEHTYHSYPVHSFSAWMREFRMLGYVTRLMRIEQDIADFDIDELALWLQAINSDVLSAVEKDSPVVRLRRSPRGKQSFKFVIHRSERGFEGEEFLVWLESLRGKRATREPYARFVASGSAHAVKLRARRQALEALHRNADAVGV